MVTVAVTGAGGFLGGHVCRALAGRGYRTIGMTRTGSTRQLPADLLERVEMREGDVLDMTSLECCPEGIRCGGALRCAGDY